MFAPKFMFAAAYAGSVLLASTASLAAEGSGKTKVNLTEEAEPDGKAWEDPARASFTIDPHGPDSFSVKLNLELVKPLTDAKADRQRALKAFLGWSRETGGDNRQNNLEIGGAYTIDYGTSILDEESGRTPDEAARIVNVSSRFSAAYARTAQYADITTATCVTAPSTPQCATQHNESLRGSAAFNIFNPFFERDAPGLPAFSIEPQFGADADWLLNSPLDGAGNRVRGGYVSAKAGLAMAIAPSFDAPRWELEASAQLRQKLYASDSRRPLIERSAVLLEASGTYYLVKPGSADGWRAGVGVTYTRGDDPLTGASNVNKIVLALRIGRY